jgi:hypothetical protein
VGSLALPAFTTPTTAALSQWHSILELAQRLPHTATPKMIGRSSFGAIDQSVARHSSPLSYAAILGPASASAPVWDGVV